MRRISIRRNALTRFVMVSATVLGVSGTALGVSAFADDPSRSTTQAQMPVTNGIAIAQKEAVAQRAERQKAASERAQKSLAAAARLKAATIKAAKLKAAKEKAARVALQARHDRAERAARAARRADPKAIAAGMVAARGWSSGEFSCLKSLWTKESGWKAHAANPSSGAYGIPQALPGSKMASAGSDWRTNPATQIKWGLGYIASSYGSPCAAWSHSQSSGWY